MILWPSDLSLACVSGVGVNNNVTVFDVIQSFVDFWFFKRMS